MVKHLPANAGDDSTYLCKVVTRVKQSDNRENALGTVMYNTDNTVGFRRWDDADLKEPCARS